MRVITLLMLVLLVGCAHPLEGPAINDDITIDLRIVPRVPHPDPETLGMAVTVTNRLYRIYIREDAYPDCIVHEVGHGTHGHWHEWMTNCSYSRLGK